MNNDFLPVVDDDGGGMLRGRMSRGRRREEGGRRIDNAPVKSVVLLSVER